MTTALLTRSARIAVIAFLALVTLTSTVAGQTAARLRVVRRAVIVDTPRPDGFVLGTVDPGVELEVYSRQGVWVQVRPPASFSRARGWIQASAVEWLTPLPGPPAPLKGTLMIRVFGAAGPTLFSAKESTEAILGSSNGIMMGGGAQVVLPNGAFVMAGYEQFKKTGTRVLVSGTQVFTLPINDDVRVTPIQVTLGYRDFKSRRLSSYLGAGAGVMRLRERGSDGTTFSKSHVSGHVLGGVEKPLGSILALAGEIQWTGAPKILGESGVSAAVGEDDLGGTTFRLKVIVGR